jgi:Na+-translocating ferredoxin:NAD+ oxidoreductase RnfA subunit
VLGVALLNVNQDNGFLASAVYGFGAAIGFSFVLVLFSSIRERLLSTLCLWQKRINLVNQGIAINFKFNRRIT